MNQIDNAVVKALYERNLSSPIILIGYYEQFNKILADDKYFDSVVCNRILDIYIFKTIEYNAEH